MVINSMVRCAVCCRGIMAPTLWLLFASVPVSEPTRKITRKAMLEHTLHPSVPRLKPSHQAAVAASATPAVANTSLHTAAPVAVAQTVPTAKGLQSRHLPPMSTLEMVQVAASGNLAARQKIWTKYTDVVHDHQTVFTVAGIVAWVFNLTFLAGVCGAFCCGFSNGNAEVKRRASRAAERNSILRDTQSCRTSIPTMGSSSWMLGVAKSPCSSRGAEGS